MLNFLSIVLIVFAILQIVLFFKIWGMTNNVSRITKLQEEIPSKEEELIRKAQLLSMNGNYDAAKEKYNEAFLLNVISLYERTIFTYGEEGDFQGRNKSYEIKYQKIVERYERMMKKINATLDKGKFDTFDKIDAVISKSYV